MNNHKVIGSFDGTFSKDKLLLTDLEYGALFEYDFQKEILSLKCKLPEKIEVVDSFLYGEVLYLFPFFEQYVYAFNLGTKEMRKINPQVALELKGNEKTRINRPIIIGNKIYIFPVYVNRELMILDLDNENLTIVEGWWKSIKQCVAVGEDDEFMVIYAFNKFWVMKDRVAILLAFDKNFKLVSIRDFGNYAFYGINADEDGLWIILHDSGDLLHWDIESNELVLCRRHLLNNNDFQYIQVVSWNGVNYALPYYNKQIAVIDKEKRNIYDLDMPEGVHRVEGNMRPFFNKYVFHNQKLYLVPLASNYLLVLDLINQKMKKYELVVNENLMDQLMSVDIQNGILNENQYLLKDFIRFVESCKNDID